MSERYYTMIGGMMLDETIEDRVRKYHNRRPETHSLDTAVCVAWEQGFDTIVTVVE